MRQATLQELSKAKRFWALCRLRKPFMAADLRVDMRQTMPVHDVAPAVFFFGCLLHMHLVDGLCDPFTLSLQAGNYFTLGRCESTLVPCILCCCVTPLHQLLLTSADYTARTAQFASSILHSAFVPKIASHSRPIVAEESPKEMAQCHNRPPV